MRELVIGSEAAVYLVPGFRMPKDYDIFSDTPQSGKDTVWHESMASFVGEGSRHATLDELYTIKVSHSYWELPNGSWDKHMSDQVTFKQAGATLIPEMHDTLYKVWEENLGKKKMNLNQDASQFFADAVPRTYDHDSIHYSVAYGDTPLYESVMKDGQSVAMDMKKVWALPFETQVALFREEVYATALERWLIPTDYRFSPRRAYALALRKTITSLTKGKSAQFISEHYDIFRDPDMNYLAQHQSKRDQLIPLIACDCCGLKGGQHKFSCVYVK